MTNRIVKFVRAARSAGLSQPSPTFVESGASPAGARRLRAGDRVRVKMGTLAGVEGTVMALCQKRRLIIAACLSQPGISIEIDDHLVERI